MTDEDSFELKRAHADLTDAIGLLMELLSRKDLDAETMGKCIAVRSFVYDARDRVQTVQSRNEVSN